MKKTTRPMVRALTALGLCAGLSAAGFAGAALTTTGAASSAGLHPVKFIGGIINATGTVAYGKGFTSVENSTGNYTITFPDTTGFTHVPAMTATPVGINGAVVIPVIASWRWQNGGATFNIIESSTAGGETPQSSAFEFTLLTTK